MTGFVHVVPKLNTIQSFVYAGHDALPTYQLKYKDKELITNCYMVNFKDSIHVYSDEINRNNQNLNKCKHLELSVQTREELRNKISFFYSRIPDEDQNMGTGFVPPVSI
ncbi:hypothetical protein MsAg5_06710 [Methanosarcinaceae archaeon Ag5]|uniref:Uncharacterized protein n=1 Tax=Methanolapillus africanus TaxID=3028297 RepID=A0AAE4SDJ0_9EURY|nr:hypothetical protein [Methanosarcinaceae archaeon Ag5]